MKTTVSVIHEGGTTEIQWGNREPQSAVIQGYGLIDAETGSLMIPFTNGSGESFVFVLGPHTQGVYPTEDIEPYPSVAPVWESNR